MVIGKGKKGVSFLNIWVLQDRIIDNGMSIILGLDDEDMFLSG